MKNDIMRLSPVLNKNSQSSIFNALKTDTLPKKIMVLRHEIENYLNNIRWSSQSHDIFIPTRVLEDWVERLKILQKEIEVQKEI